MLLIDPRIGLRLNSLEIFCAVFNMGDSREEIFEGYRQGSRQIAGGIGLKF
jgi:hypothetical protein